MARIPQLENWEVVTVAIDSPLALGVIDPESVGKPHLRGVVDGETITTPPFVRFDKGSASLVCQHKGGRPQKYRLGKVKPAYRRQYPDAVADLERQGFIAKPTTH